MGEVSQPVRVANGHPSQRLAVVTPEMTERVVAVGRSVIAQEMEGLQGLMEYVGPAFVKAVQIIGQTRGKLVVSGMGKSGHIARKIAATFASTGMPAFFVHPGEASHGDLGMIGPDDTVMMLSNSGETAELRDMIAYATRFSIPMIAMVRRPSSALVDAASVALILPEIPEASRHVKAPTTSTTMMLVLGDALAMTVMELRAFQEEEFGIFHPGGKLGRAFVRVKDLMHKGEALPVCRVEQPMSEVLITMTTAGFGCAAVLEDGRLVGIITDGDLRRHMGPALLSFAARDVMTPSPRTIRPQAMATEALGEMNRRNITTLLVADGDQLKGILHIHDCLRAGIG
jgi:arabinose-5-phosphate isomerase